MLSDEQQDRLETAAESETPVFIVTPEEAMVNQEAGTDEMVTWVFEAENVRDFAWASSRKYIWDALGHQQDDEGQSAGHGHVFLPRRKLNLCGPSSPRIPLRTPWMYILVFPLIILTRQPFPSMPGKPGAWNIP